MKQPPSFVDSSLPSHVCRLHKSLYQSFKTRIGPAGRPGTRPTRAWDRSG
jgi:hypothetical protein